MAVKETFQHVQADTEQDLLLVSSLLILLKCESCFVLVTLCSYLL